MLKKISAQKARQNFGELMDEVRLRGDRYIVNRGAKPLVAVIPVEEYIAWEQARERLPPHAVERLIDLHFDVFPRVTVETSTAFEFELIILEDFDALARTCTGDGMFIEVSGFEAPQAAERLRTARR